MPAGEVGFPLSSRRTVILTRAVSKSPLTSAAAKTHNPYALESPIEPVSKSVSARTIMPENKPLAEATPPPNKKRLASEGRSSFLASVSSSMPRIALSSSEMRMSGKMVAPRVAICAAPASNTKMPKVFELIWAELAIYLLFSVDEASDMPNRAISHKTIQPLRRGMSQARGLAPSLCSLRPVARTRSSSASSSRTSSASSMVTIPRSLCLSSTTGTESKSYFEIVSATSSWSSSGLATKRLRSMISPNVFSTGSRSNWRSETTPLSSFSESITYT